MKKWRRIRALLLALCMVPVIPATAQDDLSLEWRGEEAKSAELILSGLDESVYALQLELTLEGSCRNLEFSPDLPGSYSPDCLVRQDGGKTAAMIYLVGQEPLNRGSRLFLGMVTADDVLPAPEEAVLTLLDRDLQPIRDADGALVSLWNSGGAGESGYRVQLEQPGHGTLRASPVWAEEDETVILTVRPDTGYLLDRLEVTDGDGRRLRTEHQGGNRYAFTMPDGQVRAAAFFVRSEEELPQLPFTDVSQGDWFYEAVCYAYAHGLMQGTTQTTFAPQVTTNRGMIVTILHRLEGAPPAGQGGFSDVPAGMYCAGAVAWASAAGIVNGYGNGKFGPRDTITRQQLAAILYRYAAYKDYPTAAAGDLTEYADSSSVAPYAWDAMRWAVENVLLFGDEAGMLTPQSGATRAQAAFALTGLCLDLAGDPD